jgi:hypothetical protein
VPDIEKLRAERGNGVGTEAHGQDGPDIIMTPPPPPGSLPTGDI